MKSAEKTVYLQSGVLRKTYLFFASASLAVLSAMFILIGAAIWTSLVKKTESINTMQIAQGVTSGMSISYGSGIYISWAAFACLLAAVVPYMSMCVSPSDVHPSVLLIVILLAQLLHVPWMKEAMPVICYVTQRRKFMTATRISFTNVIMDDDIYQIYPVEMLFRMVFISYRLSWFGGQNQPEAEVARSGRK